MRNAVTSPIARKIIRTAAKIALGIVIFVALLLIALKLLLPFGVAALNRDAPHRAILSKVNAALGESGLIAAFGNVAYNPITGFTLENIRVVDTEGPVFFADRIAFNPSFMAVLRGTADLTLSAGNLILYRLPKSESPAEPAEPFRLEAFEVPDLFIDRFILRGFEIERLDIREAVAGKAFVLHPSAKADIGISSNADFSFDLNIEDLKPVAGEVPLPETLVLAGHVDTARLLIDIGTMRIASQAYELSFSGKGQLQNSGGLDFRVTAEYPDLTTASAGQFASFQSDIRIGGIFNRPEVMASAHLAAAGISDKGLGDVDLNAELVRQDAVNSGTIDVKTLFKKRPVALKIPLALTGEVLSFGPVEATAPKIAISGQGVLDFSSKLADGKIQIVADDFSHYADLIGKKIQGRAEAVIVAFHDSGVQALDAALKIERLRFEPIGLSFLKADIRFDDVAGFFPTRADLQLTDMTAPGAIIRRAALKLVGENADDVAIRLDADGRLEKAFNAAVRAKIEAVKSPAPMLTGLDAVFKTGSSRMTLSGDASEDRIDLRLKSSNFRPSDIVTELPAALEQAGIDADVKMTGSAAAPVTVAAVNIRRIGAGKIALNADLNARLADGRAMVRFGASGKGVRSLRGSAEMPLGFALYPFRFSFSTASNLKAALEYDIDLGAVGPVFLPPSQSVNGILSGRATARGTVAKPAVNGTARLVDGRYRHRDLGVHLRKMQADAAIRENGVRLQSFSATDGGRGRINASGMIGFNGGKTDLNLSMRRFHLLESNLADGMVEADLALADSPQGYIARGRIGIEKMDVTIPETFRKNIPELNIVSRDDAASAPAKAVLLNIKFDAPNQVFVRGWGLDAEFGGAFDITGTAAAPELNGTLSSIRGRYEEFGKRFTLEKADLRFQGTVPPSPYLDIEATTPTDDATASILLTGPVKEPQIKFSSQPALPEDEVLSRILFGRETANITPFQAVQLAQTLQRFSGNGGGGFDPLSTLRSLTGFDDINVGTDEEGETNVGVGKYVTDKVYLEFEKGQAENSGAAKLQVDVTPSVNIQSRIGQDAQTGGGIFWKRDY